jgi:flagellar basal-body rod protein FlgB
MFLDRLLNDGNAPVLEAAVRFASSRHRLIAENVANVDTPGYVQKDLSQSKFQALLRRRVEERTRSLPGTVGFDDLSARVENPTAGILFHDRNNRSMEQLMTEGVKNALMHNMLAELLNKQFGSIEAALKERVG